MTNYQWMGEVSLEEKAGVLAEALKAQGIEAGEEQLEMIAAWLEAERQMTREEKIAADGRALKKYEQRLKDEAKVYHQTVEAYSENNRRSRELTLGTCALKALDAVRELRNVKPLVGELYFNIGEKPEEDKGGRKIFHCSVTYHVTSAEKAHSEDDVRKEIEDTFEKMMRETDEMFPEEDRQNEKSKSEGAAV